MNQEQLLDEISKLSRRIYLQAEKDYFEVRIRNMIETFAASLEQKGVLVIEKEANPT